VIAELIFTGVVTIALPLRAWRRYRHRLPRVSSTRYIAETLLLLAVLSLLLRQNHISLSSLGLAKPWSWQWPGDMALCLGLIVGVDFWMTGKLIRQIRRGAVIPPARGLAADAQAGSRTGRGYVGVTIAGAAWEELCFRGTVLAMVPHTGTGILLGFVASSLFFGMQHLRSGPSAFVYSTGFGLVFALLFLATDNLWAVMIAHAAGNLLTVWQWAPQIEKARQNALQRAAIFLG